MSIARVILSIGLAGFPVTIIAGYLLMPADMESVIKTPEKANLKKFQAWKNKRASF